MPFNIYSEDSLQSLETNQLLNSLANYFDKQLNTVNEEIKSFNIQNDMNTINFCLSSRSNLEEYFSCVSRNSFKIYHNEHIVGMDFRFENQKKKTKKSNKNFNIVAHFNNQFYHTPPLALNLLTNTLFKHYTNSSENTINIINHPLPRNKSEKHQEVSVKNLTSYKLAAGLVFSLSFLIASFNIFLINERMSGAKHLQHLNGCRKSVFWLGTFCMDMFVYLIPIMFVFISFYVRKKINK